MERLKTMPKVVGLKQSEKAVRQGRAIQAFLAEDTDLWLLEAFETLCKEYDVALTLVPSGKELAKACKVEVSTACAVLVTTASK